MIAVVETCVMVDVYVILCCITPTEVVVVVAGSSSEAVDELRIATSLSIGSTV